LDIINKYGTKEDGKRLLFVFKSVPYPLRADGVSVRYLPIIEYLARNHEIDLIVITGSANALRNIEGLRGFCRNIHVLHDPRRSSHSILAKSLTYMNFLFPWTPPLSMVAHHGSNVTRRIVEVLGKDHYDAAVWVGGYLLPNMMDALPSLSVGKVLVDFIDSPSLWVSRAKEATFRISALERYERWKTNRWEGNIGRGVDATIYISRVDADAVSQDRKAGGRRHVIPNGINVPSHPVTERVSLPSPNIGFLGNMWYSPNVEAVEWLYREVFVPLRGIHPTLNLVIIGRGPSPPIENLGKKPGVVVTGTLEDIWPHIGAIDVFLFPLLRGAGLKNKILEAMHAGRPVVTTEIGNEGIDAADGHALVLCRTPDDFRREAMRLLGSPEERMRIGEAAHAFVKEKFSWDAILPAYENLVLGDCTAAGGGGYLHGSDPSARIGGSR
jgi:glycosyltransferase involved in cell wall biosynthesis